jgi:hypothetical protein
MTEVAYRSKSEKNTASRRVGLSGYKVFIRLLYIVAIFVYAYFLVDGFSFYSSPYRERPRHEEYRQLRPAGMTGHTYGVIGSTFMILMLSYTLRKRAKFLRNKGRLNRWLDIHIFFGIWGPLLVVLHTSFKVQGLVAVSFWSMVAVAASGIFGRYLYLQIPRNIQGEELSMKDLEAERQAYSQRLRDEYGLSDEIIGRLEKHDTVHIKEEDGILKVLLVILAQDALQPFRFGHRHRDHIELKDIPARVRGEVVRVTHKRALLDRRILLLNRVQQLFHYWHVIHKPFAIIMYSIMVVHVVVAIWTGYKWVF